MAKAVTTLAIAMAKLAARAGEVSQQAPEARES